MEMKNLQLANKFCCYAKQLKDHFKEECEETFMSLAQKNTTPENVELKAKLYFKGLTSAALGYESVINFSIHLTYEMIEEFGVFDNETVIESIEMYKKKTSSPDFFNVDNHVVEFVEAACSCLIEYLETGNIVMPSITSVLVEEINKSERQGKKNHEDA